MLKISKVVDNKVHCLEIKNFQTDYDGVHDMAVIMHQLSQFCRKNPPGELLGLSASSQREKEKRDG